MGLGGGVRALPLRISFEEADLYFEIIDPESGRLR